MLSTRSVVVALMLPVAIPGQATSVVAPPDVSLLQMFVRRWGRESPLGDLVTLAMPDSALELRFWGGFGLGGTRGLVLRRTPEATWTAHRVVVETCAVVRPHDEQLTPSRIDSLRRVARQVCRPDFSNGGQVIRADTLGIYPLELTDSPEEVWRELVRLGILGLPPKVERKWMMLDGHTFVLELRRGQVYRASEIEYLEKPEHPADETIRRVADVLSRYYRWDRP